MGTLRLPSLRTPGPLAGADAQLGSIIGLIACGGLLLTLGAVLVAGVIGLVLPLVIVGLLACVRWPALPVGLLVGMTLLIDAYYGELPAPGYPLYNGVAGGFSPWEMLVYLAVGSVVLDCVRRRRLPPMPGLIAIPLLLMAVAFGIGSFVGYTEGAGLKAQIDGLRNVLPVVVVAPLVAAVLPAARVRLVLGVVAAAIGFKALLGLGLTMQRGGPSLDNLIFYEITMNWVFMALVLCVLACRVCGVPLPWWVWVAAGLALLMFVIGLKRALWIGSVAGLGLILVLGLGRVGRRLFIPALAVTGALGWLLFSAGVAVELNGPVAERVSSLNPQKVASNTQDRYRLDERANVWIGIKEQPLLGLGQGVPWRAVEPLGIEHESARDYVHFAVLWFWMKYSFLGALAYVAIMAAVIVMGIRVRRGHPDPLMSALGLGAAASFLALVVAELTVTWTGANPSFTVMTGATIGVLAVLDVERRALSRRAGAAAGDGRGLAAPPR